MDFSCSVFILNRRLPTQKAQFTQHDVKQIQCRKVSERLQFRKAFLYGITTCTIQMRIRLK
jgi:hypothetical protein